jgi:hypothetical protein
VSALAMIVLLLVGAIVWVIAEVVKQVITREVDWWAPRLEALLAGMAALVAPPKHRKKGLRQTWCAELGFDRAPGETRVLMAAALLVASVSMWRRPPRDDDAPVVEIFAADGVSMVDAAVVLETTLAIEATSEVSAQNAQLSGTSLGVSGATATLGGVGGMSAHGVARASGSASLGLVGGLSAHAVLRVNASAGFHSDAMTRLATGDYPAVDRSLSYH